MKRLLITLLFLKCIAFAENESITINDENSFFESMFKNFDTLKNEYNLNIEVLIRISEKGEMNYKIIKNSDIVKFNMEVINFLEEKRKTTFPNLKNKAITFKTTYRAENSNKKPEYINGKSIKENNN